jgi:group I intron endonuclease
MVSGIYKITNIVTGQFYLGKSKQVSKRMQVHKNGLIQNRHNNSHLQRSFNKYGLNNFTFELLIVCEVQFLNQYERELILLTESFKPGIGFNQTMGGDGGEVPTIETRAKMSNSQKGRVPTQGTKKKQADALKGLPWTKRRRLAQTPEVSAKLSKARKERKSNRLGVVLSTDTKHKISLANVGREHTEEAKKKISESLLGNTRAVKNKQDKESK